MFGKLNLPLIFISLFSIVQTLKTQSDYNDYVYNGETISYIQNGRIHTDNKSNTSILKCKKHFKINSNSSIVIKQVQSNGLVFWIPKNGYLKKNSRLCAKSCKFQAYLPNGIIKINSSLNNHTAIIRNSKQRYSNESAFIELFENSKIKYECMLGFRLKTTQEIDPIFDIPFDFQQQDTIKIRHINKYFVEKCEQSKVEELIDHASNYDLKGHEFSTDYLDYEQISDHSSVARQIGNIIIKTNIKKYHHECLKYCEPFKINYSLSKMFIVPRKNMFWPGEYLNLHCNEGHIASIVDENRFTNWFNLECASNGKWYLKNYQKSNISNETSHNFKNLEIKKLPLCFSIDKLKELSQKKSVRDLILGNLTYSELNVRTFSMVVLFCGLLFSILILCLAIISYYTKCFVERNQLLTQSDPLIIQPCANINELPSSLPTNRLFDQTNYFQQLTNPDNLISRSVPVAQNSITTQSNLQRNTPSTQNTNLNVFESFTQNHNLNNAVNINESQLPSYEEAIALPSTNNFNFELSSNQSIVFERAQASTLK